MRSTGQGLHEQRIHRPRSEHRTGFRYQKFREAS